MQENFAKSFSQAVSKTRFGAFEKGDGARLGLARYLWNLSLCEAFYPSFHTLEVGFRNAVHREVGCWSEEPEWLRNSHPFLSDKELPRIKAASTALRKGRKELTEARLVAELGFGFWTSLLDARYDQLWPKIIAGVFPNIPRRIRTRQDISSMMHPIRRLRNLAFHHHAIWDRDDLSSTHQTALDLIGWISSPLAASLGRIDRFSAVQMAQVEPYLEHASQLIIE
jgi:hypothetical protein